MMSRSQYQILWRYNQPISAGATIVMPIGGTNTASGWAPAGLNVALMHDMTYLAFTIKGSAALNLTIELADATAALVTWITFAYPGGSVYNSVYDLPAPYAGSTGRLVVCCNYLRFRVNNPTAGNSNAFVFNARAWRD